jgi:hypothetical protein
VYLWAHNPNLCNGRAAAGKGFIASRTEGQLILPGWAMCRVGRATIGLSAIARLSRFVNDRDVAYSALFSRLAEAGSAQVSAAEIRAAESAVISRFGSRGEYLAALAKAGASRAVARSVLADSLRRHEVGLRLRVSRPSGASIAAFYEAYPELRVRSVSAQGGAPWWLGGRRSGLALATFVPERLFEAPTGSRTSLQTLSGRYTVRVLDETRPLAAVPLAQARPAISAALTQFARRDAVTRWSTGRQEALLRKAVCRRDNLPEIATIDLTTYLPFLALAG